ncbi:MAG: hypothetical protein ACOYLS_15415 [Polymorphobacter sp.]
MIKLMFVSAAVMLAAPVLAQDAMAPAAPAMPVCSAKVTDGCVQSAAAEKRAMSGEQADKRDARNGGMWAPDGKTKTAATKTGAAPR